MFGLIYSSLTRGLPIEGLEMHQWGFGWRDSSLVALELHAGESNRLPGRGTTALNYRNDDHCGLVFCLPIPNPGT